MYNPYGNQMMGGVPYNNGMTYAQQNMPKQSNPLTTEEIQLLRRKDNPFSLQITNEQRLKGICFHLDENGNNAIITNQDGSNYCPICGHTWFSQDVTEEEAKDITQRFISLLQNIKTMYINFPDKAAREFFQIIPLCEKVPELLKIASDIFRNYEGMAGGYMNGNNPFALFNQIGSGVYGMGMGMGYNPYNAGYNPNMQQYAQTNPAMYQQPQQQMAAQAPVAPAANPFVQQAPQGYNNGYAAPAGYQPQTQGYAYQPGQVPAQPQVAPQPAQQAAPAPQQAPTQGAATVGSKPAESTGQHTP